MATDTPDAQTTKKPASKPRSPASRPPAVTRPKISQEEIRNRIAKDLQGGSTVSFGAPTEGMASLIRLNLDQVESYGRNPRHARNEKYLEIKESIRARGLDTRLIVTKRPGSAKYTLSNGGKTRLSILRELWEETQDSRFHELDFELRPYKGEIELLAAHISENFNRGDMVYWDKATAIRDLLGEIQAETGTALSIRDAIEAFKSRGLPDLSRTLFGLYQFSTQHLHCAGYAAFGLTVATVRDAISPARSERLRLCKIAGIDEAEFDSRVWGPALQRFGVQFESPDDGGEADWRLAIERIDAEFVYQFGEQIGVTDQAGFMGLLSAAQTAEPGSALADLRPQLDLHLPPPQPLSGAGVQHSLDEESDDATSSQEGTGGSEEDEGGTGVILGPRGVNEDRNVKAPRAGVVRVPSDGSAPPMDIVKQVEIEQRQRHAEELASRAKTPAVGASLWIKEMHAGSASVEREPETFPVTVIASDIADLIPTLAGLVKPGPTPFGWMVDLPEDMLDSGGRLSPAAKQVFWVLAQSSLQLRVGHKDPSAFSGTVFGQFLELSLDRPDEDHWSRVMPVNDQDFLFELLFDPAYFELGTKVQQLFVASRNLIANRPEMFEGLGLQWQELQEDAVSERMRTVRSRLMVFVERGANKEMVRALFPGQPIDDITFLSGRPREPNRLVASQVYEAWRVLEQTVPNLQDRYLELSGMFPDEPLSMFWSLIVGGAA